jgi:hypothetical protein
VPLTEAYDLPAGPAERSLKLFSKQSGREVLFATQAVRTVQTRAVRGEMTAREALEQLLAGTDLAAFHDERTDVFSVRRKIAAEADAGRPRPGPASDDSRESKKKVILTPALTNR